MYKEKKLKIKGEIYFNFSKNSNSNADLIHSNYFVTYCIHVTLFQTSH